MSSERSRSLWGSTAAGFDSELADLLEDVTTQDVERILNEMIASGEWDKRMAALERRIKPFRTKVTAETMRKVVGR